LLIGYNNAVGKLIIKTSKFYHEGYGL